MKVLTLSRNYPNDVLPHLGLWVEGLVKHTTRHCEQRVVAPVPYAPPLPRFAENYTRFRRVPPYEQRNGIQVWHPRFLTGPGYSFHNYEASTYYWGIVGTIDRLREEYPFDVIHAHFGYPDGVAAARLGKRYNVPLLITEHAIWHPWMDNYPRVRQQAVWAAQQAAFHLAGSCALRDSILDFTGQPEKTGLIPIGTDTTVFTPAPTGHRPKANQIVYVGRLQFVKGVDVLFKAMRQVASRQPNTKLVVIGGSFYQQWAEEEVRLRALVEELHLMENIEFVGIKSPPEIAQYIHDSALLVLPSRRESFGTVLIEALACGTPVVATRCGGPEDVVTDEVGLLVPKENPAALAEAIEYVIRNRANYDPYQLRKYAMNFSWQRVAEQVVELYRRAIEQTDERVPLL